MTRKVRDEVIATLGREGVRVDVIRQLLSAGASLHRIAELECSSEAADRDRVTRIARQEQRIRRNVEALCKANGLAPIFGGDPRGAVLLVKVESGRTNDFGGRGIFVA